MSIRSTNLNLLPVLQALLREESVSAAAKRVSLSQPAVSGALGQLRVMLDDPLLVRVGRTMRLSPRAERLRPLVDRLCADLEQLFEAEAFDPAQSEASFVVAAPDHLAFLLSRVLVPRLGREAPGIRLRFVDVPYNLHEPLSAGLIDLAVCGNFDLWPSLSYRSLLVEGASAVVARSHPLASRRHVKTSDLAGYPTVGYDTPTVRRRDESKMVTGLTLLDWSAQIHLGQFTDAVLLAVEPPVVAMVPSTLANHLSTMLPLVTLRLVDGESDAIDTGMFWAPMQEHAVEQIWLRTLIADCVAAATGDQTAEVRTELPARVARPSSGARRRAASPDGVA